MPQFETTAIFPRPVEEVFEFFRRPANVLAVNPPELNLQLIEAPEVLQRGSRVVLQARKFGIPQRLESEVTVVEPPCLIVDELQQGPFRKWVQTHRFEKSGTGTRVTFRIDFEPPGGMLGLMVNVSVIEAELRSMFPYRIAKLHEVLGATPPGSV
jgi:ligand-binding SRPBCC domain-containing protein